MIIILKGANFSNSNIGTLSSWRITRSLGAGTTYNGPVSVDKDAAFSATVTLAEGYEISSIGISVTMGGNVLSDVYSISGNVITFSIPSVTGNIVIKVPTLNINAGETDPIVITNISVDYTQGNTTIFEAQDLDDLRRYLTVHATYSDGTENVINDYTLSGTLQAGTSSITVTSGDCNTSFEVATTAFTLPSGYTKYGYIQAKANSKGSTVTQDKFIWLPAFENINELSLEATLGQKPNVTNATIGIFGARPTEGLGYTVYWNGTDDSPFYARVRNKQVNIPEAKNLDKVKLVVDNPVTSPFTVLVNNEYKATGAWDAATDTVLSREISLFNNIPEGNTSGMYLNFTIRIGDMLFRDASGQCVAYFTPCTDANKKIGMYDQISQTFYTAEVANVVTVGNSAVLYQVGNW